MSLLKERTKDPLPGAETNRLRIRLLLDRQRQLHSLWWSSLFRFSRTFGGPLDFNIVEEVTTRRSGNRHDWVFRIHFLSHKVGTKFTVVCPLQLDVRSLPVLERRIHSHA